MERTEVLLSAPQNQEVNEQSRITEAISNGKRLIGRGLLILCLGGGGGVVAGTGEAVLTPERAEASVTFVNNYPDMDAADCSTQFGSNSWCKEENDTPGYTSAEQWSDRTYGYRNCTDGVAFWVGQYTGGTTIPGWGNAKFWATKATEAGHNVKAGTANNIEPGDIAQSEDGSVGHVGFVISVTKNQQGVVTGIDVAELNHVDNSGTYDIYPYAARNAAGKIKRSSDKDWDYFIDVNGLGKGLGNEDLTGGGGGGGTPPVPANKLIVRQGNTLIGKNEIADMWTTLTTAATDVSAAGERIAIRDTSGNIVAKDGLGGTWYVESGPVDEFVVTPTLLVTRQGGAVYVKAGLSDTWTTVTSSGAVDIEAAGDRIAYKDVNGRVWARDGVGSAPLAEADGVTEFDVTPNLLLIRQGNTLSAKQGLADLWTTLSNSVTDVQAAGNRIAVIDTAGNLYAKDGLGGTWYNETSGVTQYAVTPNLLIVRQGNTLIGKVALADLWTTLASNATDVKAAGSRMAMTDTSGNIKARDGLGSSWLTETNGATQYTLSKSVGS